VKKPMKSYAERLLEGLDEITALMDELLDASTINFVPNRARRELARTGVAILCLADGQWGPSNTEQERLQRVLLERWNPWLEQVQLLLSEDTKRRQRKLKQSAAAIEDWMQRGKYWVSLPPTIPEAKQAFRREVSELAELFSGMNDGNRRVVVVPDTNVLLRCPDVTGYAEVLGTRAFTVLLVPGVLGELDSHKVNHKNQDVREKAQKFTNRVKGWRNQGSLSNGVRVQGDVYVQVEGREPDMTKTLQWLQVDVMDDRIIASVLEVQRRAPADCVVLLTGDTLMLAKADAASIPTADLPDPSPSPLP